MDKSLENTKASVLVVDENRSTLETLAKVLQQGGYDTVQANSADSALQIVAHSAPDLAIIGMGMLSMSGVELVRQFQENPLVPCMLVATSAELDAFRADQLRHVVGYLWKPLDVRQILPSLEAVLSSIADTKELRRSETALTYALNAEHETNIAVGILMERYRLARKQAFEILRSHARSNRRKISSIAAELIAASQLLNLPNIQAEHKTARVERRPEMRRGVRSPLGQGAMVSELNTQLATELSTSTQ